MEAVMKTYGKFFLVGMTLVLLFVFCAVGITDDNGNRGIFQMIGAQMHTESADYEEYTDYDTYASESVKSFPKITVDASAGIHVGAGSVAGYIRAVDFTGAELPVRIVMLEDSRGNDVSGWHHAESGEIDFQMPGIYTLTVAATDSGNRETKVTVRIPVIR